MKPLISTIILHMIFINYKTKKTSNLTVLAYYTQTFALCKATFKKVEMFPRNLDFTFDSIALTGTWYTNNNSSFSPGKLQGYQKYEGIYGSTQKRRCSFFMHDSIANINRDGLNKQYSGKNSEFEAK